MKRTLLMLVLVGVALTSCEKKESYKFKGYGYYVYLNGVEQPKFKSTTTQHSLYEIVRDPRTAIRNTFETAESGERDYYRQFADEERDTINNRLYMRATDILTEDGQLIYDFINSHNVYLQLLEGDNLDARGDTVGYIPQSIIDSAREQIIALYEQERYDEIYELFHTAFTFFTCTGQEYKDIMARGGN